MNQEKGHKHRESASEASGTNEGKVGRGRANGPIEALLSGLAGKRPDNHADADDSLSEPRLANESTLSTEQRVANGIQLAIVYPFILPTPAFWIAMIICRYFRYWSDWFYIGIALGVLGVPIGFLVGYHCEELITPEDNVSRNH